MTEESTGCAGFSKGSEEERKITVHDPEAVRRMIEETYGRAARFVIRAVNLRHATFTYYGHSPARNLRLILDHAERVDAMKPPFITEEQKAAAREAIWEAYWAISDLDSKELSRDAERSDRPHESPAGDAHAVHLIAGRYDDPSGATGAAVDSDEGAMARPRVHEATDDRYGMRDPALELARYKMNPRPSWPTPGEEARYKLIEQQWIMDLLRTIERRERHQIVKAARPGEATHHAPHTRAIRLVPGRSFITASDKPSPYCPAEGGLCL